jgi:hypothetical protein
LSQSNEISVRHHKKTGKFQKLCLTYDLAYANVRLERRSERKKASFEAEGPTEFFGC